MNNKLLLSASLAAFIGIIMAIHICDKEKNKERNKKQMWTVPVQMNHNDRDTMIHYNVVVVNDSMVVFDSLGIKITGYNKN